MKKFLLIILTFLLISTTFLSDNQPGWYQQQLPVTNTVTDISFVDSLKGWLITERNGGDAYILHTTDGGDNWTIQFQQVLLLSAIQMIDSNIGYVSGSAPPGIVLKTTNGGNNWNLLPELPAYPLWNLKFVNKDTGWVCSDDLFDGGIFKTTNGGTNWTRQTTLRALKLFFLNKDTGWSLADGSISKTTNGGNNWFFLHSVEGLERDLFFLNNDTGWVISGGAEQNGIIKTSNGGLNWFVQLDPTPFGSAPNSIFIYNNSKGWIAAGFFTILSLANDSIWGKQSVPQGFHGFNSIQMMDTSLGYSGGTIFVKTIDGGGVITNINENYENVPDNYTLYQNYPNPFNPKTIIPYELHINGYVSLKIYDIQGKEVNSLLISEKHSAGNYKVEFDGNELSSGVYFYRMDIFDERAYLLFTETKKMLLVR